MAKKEYNLVKNYLHNELGLSKELVIEIATQYIEKSIDKVISDKIDSKWVEGLIVRKIGEVITGERDYSGRWQGESKATDFIKKIIKETVKKEVIDRINFGAIELSLRGPDL
jgi:hypothetical protein